jgi:hypothetical protein
VNTRINRSAHIPGNPNNHPDVAAAIAATIGTLVRDLLTEHPNIEFDSIRIQTLNGNTAIVSGRPPREPFGPAGCSSCHQPAGRPHTDYCHADGIVGRDPRRDPCRDAVAVADSTAQDQVDAIDPTDDEPCTCLPPGHPNRYTLGDQHAKSCPLYIGRRDGVRLIPEN